MTDNKIKIFEVLLSELKAYPMESKAHGCLKTMVLGSINTIKAQIDEPATFTRKQLLVSVEGKHSAGQKDSKALSAWIKEEMLIDYLNRIIQSERYPFTDLGFIPVVRANYPIGGKGNEKLFWLDIKEKQNPLEEENTDKSSIDTNRIIYQRADPNTIRISWFYRPFFNKGELRNRSFTALLLFSLIVLGILFWLAYFILTSLVLIHALHNLSFLNLMLIPFITVLPYSLWRYWLIPICNLPDHRVIKAPSSFLAFTEDAAEIEMYRDANKNPITRFTRITATCPVCTANVLLKTGYPDQKAPLVGRCVESPFAHVYSFDRVTLEGKRL